MPEEWLEDTVADLEELQAKNEWHTTAEGTSFIQGAKPRDLSCFLGCNAVYTGKEQRFEGTQYLHIPGQAIQTIFLNSLT
jgi:hypothetical protein